MICEMLGDVFDPKKQGFLINDIPSSTDPETKLDRLDYETKLKNEITENLISDVEESGVKVNYSIRVLISEIALNLIFLSRLKFYLVHRELIQRKNKYRPLDILTNRMEGTKRIKYDIYESDERIHPLYNDYVLKLEKTINQQLGILGLLPEQQREQHKIRVIENYKKRLVEIETGNTSYSKDLHVKSEKELQLNPTK